MKLTKEDIDKVRNIEGFPIAKDEDIIALSDPPYYTACPNPFIEDFIKQNGKPYDEATDDYHREPFAADVEEDKHDLIYNIHSYHTKVPPKAIKKYILHYTKPSDIVFDGFCGTGMTGVAAQMCEENNDNLFSNTYNYEYGARIPIISDISTIATFIAGNYNQSIKDEDINNITKYIQILKEEIGYLYLTNHTIDNKIQKDTENNAIQGTINYVVWSDIFICSKCSHEYIYYDVSVDKVTNESRKEFNCPSCNFILSKARSQRAITLIHDEMSHSTIQIQKKVPVLINYSIGTKRYNKKPDEKDLNIISEVENKKFYCPIPLDKFESGDKTSELFRANINYVRQIYVSKTLYIISKYYQVCKYNNKCMFLLTSTLPKLTILNRFMPEHGSRALVGPMAGTYYIPALSVENNVIQQLEFQFKKLKNLKYKQGKFHVTTQSATNLKQICQNTIDYIFVDPPFGANIMYSELNYISESWLRCKTNIKMEAIVNRTQKKKLIEYKELMLYSFSEMYRILKPNRWITIEFHNSKNSVWNSIQETLNESGFVIADVRTLDKEKKTINQFNAHGAVNQDLIISAYKPKESFKREFFANAGNVQTAWDFVRQHLEKLPVVVPKGEKLEMVAERQAFLLFDRMVAYHVMNGIPVPLDAVDFYKGLDERFLKSDSMYFLQDQINAYDIARKTAELENMQMLLTVDDEKSAISWLYKELEVPHTYAEIMPKFMQEIRSVAKYEKLPELSILLEENFIQDENGKWYIPDLTKSGDIAKLREKRLLKDFEEYIKSTGKIKNFRTEAIRAGFARLWKDKNYEVIIKVAERLPEEVIQEDEKLLMYYDISLGRVG
jgi:16S rRNA G966 N2-methylase RsmD/DNA-directed RNA polymerase subunit RPC12/RpoP